jgi:hypothetical protein
MRLARHEPRFPCLRINDPGAYQAIERQILTGTQCAESDADLAARRPGQELTERDDIDVSHFIQPFAALYEFPPEVAKMRDRPTEARNAEPQKDEQHFEERSPPHRPGFKTFPLTGELMLWAAAER